MRSLSWSLLSNSMLVTNCEAIRITIMASARGGFSYRLVLDVYECPVKAVVASGHRDTIFDAITAAQSDLVSVRRANGFHGP